MRKRALSVILATTLGAGAAGGVVLIPTFASADPSGSPASSSAPDEKAADTNRVAKLKEALKGLVADGTLTQAQADKVATTLDAALPKHAPRGPKGHHGPGREGHKHLADVAQVIGVTPAELRAALESGKSLADVAATKGISKAALIDKLVSAIEVRIAANVKSGKITQAQADKRKAGLKGQITATVERKGLPPRPDRGDRPEGPPPNA